MTSANLDQDSIRKDRLLVNCATTRDRHWRVWQSSVKLNSMLGQDNKCQRFSGHRPTRGQIRFSIMHGHQDKTTGNRPNLGLHQLGQLFTPGSKGAIKDNKLARIKFGWWLDRLGATLAFTLRCN